ncbi:hypothetical protein [Mesorhizobium carmichaelinearum]|uniref:hypothetical protein n=1 Tax=Mesorhizobium carmichaelinearum TaxID=1208188 RepID=UPI00117C8B44|nr:hypothetical protein [Mesorhizobium carmichaelinearum]
MPALQLCNEIFYLFRRFEHHRKVDNEMLSKRCGPLHHPGSAMQRFAHPSISRHGLSRRDDPLKSTKFYYPAKIFRLLSTAAMTMIRTLAFSPDRRDVRIVRAIRMQALR